MREAIRGLAGGDEWLKAAPLVRISEDDNEFGLSAASGCFSSVR